MKQEVPKGTTRKRVNRLKSILSNLFDRKHQCICVIYFWEPGPHGLRIAEISFVEKERMAGFAFMRCDPPSAPLILYSEEFLLEGDRDEAMRLEDRIFEVGRRM